MRTSLNEIKTIEEHLFKRTHPADSLFFQANIIINPDLREKVALQQTSYQTIQQYGRKQLKAELETVHQKLANKPNSFMKKLINLFKK